MNQANIESSVLANTLFCAWVNKRKREGAYNEVGGAIRQLFASAKTFCSTPATVTIETLSSSLRCRLSRNMYPSAGTTRVFWVLTSQHCSLRFLCLRIFAFYLLFSKSMKFGHDFREHFLFAEGFRNLNHGRLAFSSTAFDLSSC